MFKFKDENKVENIQTTKIMLESLKDKITPLLEMEVGIDFNQSDRAFDMSLYSTFNTKDDLAAYVTHPAHLEVVAFIKNVTEISKVVDYIKD